MTDVPKTTYECSECDDAPPVDVIGWEIDAVLCPSCGTPMEWADEELVTR